MSEIGKPTAGPVTLSGKIRGTKNVKVLANGENFGALIATVNMYPRRTVVDGFIYGCGTETPQANANLIADAFNVYHETGLSPRQLADERDETRNEIASVLILMDGLAEQWGDEGVFRRCRDRLRVLATATEESNG